MSTTKKKIVKLTASEIKRAAAVGMGRRSARSDSNFGYFQHPDNEKDYNSKLSEYINDKKQRSHFLGVIGEMAYAKFVGGKIDERILYEGDDGMGDVGRAEVKASTWRGENIELKIPKKEYHREAGPEKYVLVRVSIDTPDVVELIGEISAERFASEKEEKQYGRNYPVNYIIGADKLDEVVDA